MTDFEDEFDDEGTDEVVTPPQPLDKNIRAQLREATKAKKELAELRAELAAEKRNVQFDKAGIPEDGLGTMFRKGYEGEVSVEAIHKTAVEWGLIKTNPEINDNSNDSELDALRRTQGATTGGDGNSPDAAQLYLAQLEAAKTPEEVMAAVNGDSGKKIGVFSQRGAL